MSAVRNALSRALWCGLAPIHQPLSRQLEAFLEKRLEERLSAELDARLEPTLTAALECTSQAVQHLDALIAHTDHSTRETDVALNTLLDECLRLREQVETLHRLVHHEGDCGHESDSPARLSLLEHDDPCDEFEADPARARGQAV